MKNEFSVLMSVYIKENAEYFDLAIKSILVEQSIKPTEFVLIADGPLSIGLNSVIDKYVAEYSTFKVYRLEKNLGLGKALNYGLEKCTYEIIFRADSDDICTFHRFEKQLDFLNLNSDIDILGGAIEEFIDNPSLSINKKMLPLNNIDIVRFSKLRNPINHMTVVFKKSQITSIGSYMDLPYLEDYFLWIRAIKHGLVLHNIDDTVVKARIGNGMVERRSNRKYISSWKVLNKYMKHNKMVSSITYFRNMVAIRLFIYTPKIIKKIYYKYILRKNAI
jgi:glycosyltransferase involved in cell wall biosynthesis